MSFFSGKPSKVILGTTPTIPIVHGSVPTVVTTSTSTPINKTIYSSTYSYTNVPVTSTSKVISQNEYNYKTATSTNVATNAYDVSRASEFRGFEPSNGCFYESLLPSSAVNNNVYEVSPGAEELKKITYRPPMELYSTDSFIIILMYLPGVSKANLNVELEKQLLKIVGKKEKLDIEELKEEIKYHTKIVDRLSEYYFCKIFQLPPTFSTAGEESITCTLKDGELMIKIVANKEKDSKHVIKIDS